MRKDQKTSLREIGFSDKEEKVYLALLELGKATVVEISKKARVERTNVYRILDKLLNIPLIQKLVIGKKTEWSALHPRYLKNYVQKQKMAVLEIFPELEAIYNLNEEKPKLSYFEGNDRLAEMVLQIVNETKRGGTILSFSVPGATFSYFGNKKFSKAMALRVSKQITSKIVIPDISEVPSYKLGMDFKNWREIKLVDREKYPFKSSFNIWNNKIAIMTVKSQPMGVIIEDKDISDTLRSIFEVVWRGLPLMTE